MREIVLAYNFSDERLSKLRRALMPLKFRIKAVSPDEFQKPVGTLAGFKEVELAPDDGDCPESFDEEMLLMCGLTNGRIDALINALYKKGVGKIDLKAVLTPSNICWSSNHVYREVKADHERMKNK